MDAMERLGRKLIEKDFIESVFKVMSYLAISAATTGLAIFSFNKGELANGLFFFVLAVGLGVQTFFYSYKYVSIPLCQAVWEKVDYGKDIAYLAGRPTDKKHKMQRTLLLSWPVLVAVTLYAIGIYGITVTMQLLIELDFSQIRSK